MIEVRKLMHSLSVIIEYNGYLAKFTEISIETNHHADPQEILSAMVDEEEIAGIIESIKDGKPAKIKSECGAANTRITVCGWVAIATKAEDLPTIKIKVEGLEDLGTPQGMENAIEGWD